ncbi:unnamed protein product [Boreogadus saida]
MSAHSRFLNKDKKMFQEDLLGLTALKTRGLFQRKLEVFKEDLQGECANFPTVKEVQGERDQTPFVDFVDKLIVNFSKRFDSFSFGQQLTLFIQNPFLITDMRGFTQEVKQLFSPDLKPWQEKLELISHTEQER